MKLHIVAGSPNCRKVQAVINHLGLPVEIKPYAFPSPELRSPDYLGLNANAMVPVLEDGSFVLWESNAINQYLADKAGDEALFPRDPQKRADVVRWQCWEIAHFNRAFSIVTWETVLKPAFDLGDANQGLLTSALSNLDRFAAVLDRHMTKRTYVAGDNLTLADYSLVVLEGYRAAIPFDWSPYPAVNAYLDRMRENPHWAKTTRANADRQKAA